MNIYAEPGTHVIMGEVSDEQANWAGADDPRKYLSPEKVYTVAYTEVHSQHTRVFLREFPDRWFNSVCFKEIDLCDYGRWFSEYFPDDKRWEKYRRINLAEMRPYLTDEVLPASVAISNANLENGSPKVGDMIVRNPDNHNDQWLISEDHFVKNFENLNRRGGQNERS